MLMFSFRAICELYLKDVPVDIQQVIQTVAYNKQIPKCPTLNLAEKHLVNSFGPFV